MKHPSQATLALHAGGDLGLLARMHTAGHVARCEQCRDEVAAFGAAREITRDLSEIPEVPWNRLAVEMKANIRLGLAAGDCVRASDLPLRATPLFTGVRAAVAVASIIAVTVAAVVIERPAPVMADETAFVEATTNGVGLTRGKYRFSLMNTGSGHVMYSSDARGAIGARSVDPETHNVTLNKVYVE